MLVFVMDVADAALESEVFELDLNELAVFQLPFDGKPREDGNAEVVHDAVFYAFQAINFHRGKFRKAFFPQLLAQKFAGFGMVGFDEKGDVQNIFYAAMCMFRQRIFRRYDKYGFIWQKSFAEVVLRIKADLVGHDQEIVFMVVQALDELSGAQDVQADVYVGCAVFIGGNQGGQQINAGEMASSQDNFAVCRIIVLVQVFFGSLRKTQDFHGITAENASLFGEVQTVATAFE